jgi:hypothetical protein
VLHVDGFDFFGKVLQSSIEGGGGKYKLKHGPCLGNR